MKKSHILLLFFIAICIGVLASQLGNVSSYYDFKEAKKKEGKEVRIKGTLSPGKLVEYDPLLDANAFSFFLLDEDGRENKVVCYDEKPRDFEKSDEIVLTGKMKGETFFATDMLVKCPSKYVETEIQKTALQ